MQGRQRRHALIILDAKTGVGKWMRDSYEQSRRGPRTEAKLGKDRTDSRYPNDSPTLPKPSHFSCKLNPIAGVGARSTTQRREGDPQTRERRGGQQQARKEEKKKAHPNPRARRPPQPHPSPWTAHVGICRSVIPLGDGVGGTHGSSAWPTKATERLGTLFCRAASVVVWTKNRKTTSKIEKLQALSRLSPIFVFLKWRPTAVPTGMSNKGRLRHGYSDPWSAIWRRIAKRETGLISNVAPAAFMVPDFCL